MQAISRLDLASVAAAALQDDRHVEAVVALADLLAVMQRSRMLTREGAPMTAILIHLVKHGPMRPADLAAAMHVEPSTVSRHLAQLVADGAVDRTVDPTDGRAYIVTATKRGQQRVEAAVADRVAIFEQVMAEWSDDDLRSFARLIARFSGEFETRLVEGATPTESSDAVSAVRT